MARKSHYVRVKNSTGREIVKGAVTHATESYGIQTITLDGLPDGEYSEIIEMYTSTFSRDYWWVTWSNDGLNYVAYNQRNPINDHESKEAPGVVELIGGLSKSNLAVCFSTDKAKTDMYKIKNPWD